MVKKAQKSTLCPACKNGITKNPFKPSNILCDARLMPGLMTGACPEHVRHMPGQ